MLIYLNTISPVINSLDRSSQSWQNLYCSKHENQILKYHNPHKKDDLWCFSCLIEHQSKINRVV